MSEGWGGPDLALMERISRASQGPSWLGLDEAAEAGLKQRIIAAGTWEALSPADQAFIEQNEREVNAGLSPTLQHPDNWAGADWAAEDRAVEEQTKALGEGWVGL